MLTSEAARPKRADERTTGRVLERVFHVANAQALPSGENADNVEAEGVEVGVALGEVLYGERAKGGLLARCHGFQRISEAGPAPQLDLDEDEGVFRADYQVDLPAARPVVALDQPVAAPGQVAQREVLTPRSGGLLPQAPTPA